MSKLEDILPELRKGRRAKFNTSSAWVKIETVLGKYTSSALMDNTWILEPEPKKTKQVYQWRVKYSSETWAVDCRLYTEEEAKKHYKEMAHEIHSGPFEVEE